MKISGILSFKPRLDDYSSFLIKFFQNEDETGEFFTINVDKDGKFSTESSQCEKLQVWFIEIYENQRLIRKCGGFKTPTLEEIKIIDLPYEKPKEEPTTESINITGTIKDISGNTSSYGSYTIEIEYTLLLDNKSEIVSKVTTLSKGNGNFTATIYPRIGGKVNISEKQPLLIKLYDGQSKVISHQCYLVNSAKKVKDDEILYSELNGNTILIEFSTKKPEITQVEISEKPVENNVKIRGKVVDKNGKLKIRNNQVIIYGTKDTENAKPEVLGICYTDGEGNFSSNYPTGKFKSGYAIVSIKPDELKDIVLKDNGEFPDFLWIILESLPENMSQDEHDNCACNNKTPQLPDMEELVTNSAYSQDIGGSCINFTTPNRALEEFNYHMVVRTSDPELFGISLERAIERVSYINNRISSIDEQLKSFSPQSATTIDYSAIKLIGIARQHAEGMILYNKSKMISETESATATENITQIKEATKVIKNEAIDFLKQKIYNPNIITLRQERITLTSEKERLERFINNKGRIVLDGKHPIDWDDSDGNIGIVQASTIAYGHLLKFKQVWRAAGYSLGDLLYSLPLAPGQKKQIAVFDWDRKETAAKSESLDYRDMLNNSLVHDRDISEIVRSNLSESMSGSSHNKSEGNSIGAGVGYGSSGSAAGAGEYSGFSLVGAVTSMFGISGGANKSSGESWSDASQSSMRNLSASTSQQLRDRTMQNASSLRSQRATVVTSVGQSESFKISTETIANHNHCHAVTIQYFEVLRHFALHQELSDVQECLFVPMLIENFDRKKILRWRDTLSTKLYAPSYKYRKYLAGFDALQRIESDLNGDEDAYSDFPKDRYCDEDLTEIFGDLKVKLHVVRPLHTLPTSTEPTFEERRDAIINAFISNGLNWWLSGRQVAENLANLQAEKIEENFQRQLQWSNFAEEYLEGMKVKVLLNNSSNMVDLKLDLSIIAKKDLGAGSRDNTRIGDFEIIISMKPSTETLSILSGISRAEIKSIVISNTNTLPYGSTCLLKTGGLKYRTDHYAGILFDSNAINNDIASGDTVLISTPMNKDEVRNPRKEDAKNAEQLIQHLNSNKEHYHKILWLFLDEQRMFNLLDKYYIQVPKLKYLTGTKNGEKIYGLELGNDGKPVLEYQTRSVASVVELTRIGMAGNSVIFPVARGLNLNKDFLLIPVYEEISDVIVNDAKKKIGVILEDSKIELLDLYKPLPGTKSEPKPYRVSVPTKGLFAEAVTGACNSCEKIDDSRFWKWEEHPIDEPTTIQAISTDSRRTEPLSTDNKDFPAPIINIQNTPSAPDPQGLANALALMGKSDIFKDITGLDQTQKNALQAMLSNQEAAKSFADIASKLAIKAGENTQHAADKVVEYDLAKRGQKIQAMEKIKDIPVDNETKSKYYDDAMKQIMGDDRSVSGALESLSKKDSKPQINLPQNADNVEFKDNQKGIELKYNLPKDVVTEKKDDKTTVTTQTTDDPLIKPETNIIDTDGLGGGGVENEETVTTSNFAIDENFIHEIENPSNLKTAVVPAAGKSGVTVADGLDLGQQNEASLKAMGISSSIIEKFKPYLGLQRADAEAKLNKIPLTLTQSEIDEINEKVIGYYASKLEKEYNAKSIYEFAELPKEAQTVIYSVFHQYGSLKRTPNFFNLVATKDWKAAVKELRNFGDKYPTRRKKEANLLENLVPKSSTKTFDSATDFNTYYAQRIVDKMESGTIGTAFNSKTQLEEIIAGNTVNDINPTNTYITILPIVDAITEAAANANYDRITIGSFIRTGTGHGEGRCIDINLKNGTFEDDKAIELVKFVLKVIKDLDDSLKPNIGFGLPYQGDFIKVGTGDKFHTSPKPTIINDDVRQLIEDNGGFIFPDNNNHLHIQIKH